MLLGCTVLLHAPQCGQMRVLGWQPRRSQSLLCGLSDCKTSVPLTTPLQKKRKGHSAPASGGAVGEACWPPCSRWEPRGDWGRWARRHVLSAAGFAPRWRELVPSGSGRWSRLQVRGEGRHMPRRWQVAQQAEQRGKAGVTAGRTPRKTRCSVLLADPSREVVPVGTRRTRGVGTRSWDQCVHLSLT